MTARAGTDAPLFPLRSVVLGAFLPTLVLEIGAGAMPPGGRMCKGREGG